MNRDNDTITRTGDKAAGGGNDDRATGIVGLVLIIGVGCLGCLVLVVTIGVIIGAVILAKSSAWGKIFVISVLIALPVLALFNYIFEKIIKYKEKKKISGQKK
jgi:CBS domain containing-hemolysin-like protein